MVGTDGLSIRQSGSLLLVFLVAGLDVFEPAVTGGEALWSLALALAVALVMTAVLLDLALRFPTTDVLRYAVTLWGSPLGQAAGAVYVLTLVFGGAAGPLFQAGMAGGAAFSWPRAAVWAFLALGTAGAGYLAYRGQGSVARLGEYGAVVAAVLVLVAGVTILPRIDWAGFTRLPVYWPAVLRGAGALLSRFSSAFILLLVLPRTKNARAAVNPVFGVIFLAAFFLGIGILATAVPGVAATPAPCLSSLQLVRAGVFGRTGWSTAGAVILWLALLVLKAGIGYWLAGTALAATMGCDARRTILPLGIGVLVLAGLLWSNAGQSYLVFARYFRLPAYAAGLVIPALLLLTATWGGACPPQAGPADGEGP